MANVPKPPKKQSGKGEPPVMGQASHVVGNATEKPAASDKTRVSMPVRASETFRDDCKQFGLDHKMSYQALAIEAMYEYMVSRGFTPRVKE